MPVLGSITNRDVWRVTGTGQNAASFVPEEQNLTISVREDYRFAPATGVNYLGATTTIGPTTVMTGAITPALGGGQTIPIAGNPTESELNNAGFNFGVFVSASPSGYPRYQLQRAQQGGLVLPAGTTLSSTPFQSNQPVYISTVRADDTTLNFTMVGGRFGATNSLSVTQASTNLAALQAPETAPGVANAMGSTAGNFLVAFAADIVATFSNVTVVNSGVSGGVTGAGTGTLSIVLNLDENDGVTTTLMSNDEVRGNITDTITDVSGAARQSSYTLQYIGMQNLMPTARNFAVSVSTSQPMTLAQILNTFATSINAVTGTPWNAVVSTDNRELTITSTTAEFLPGSVMLIETEPAGRTPNPSDVNFTVDRLAIGGESGTSIGEGLTIDNATGVISSNATSIGVVREGTVGFVPTATLLNGTFTVTDATDPGPVAQAFIDAIYATDPADGNIPGTPVLDQDILLAVTNTTTNVTTTRFLRRGSGITFVAASSEITLNNVLNDVPNGNISIGAFVVDTYTDRVDLRAGTGIALTQNTDDGTLVISQRVGMNPATDAPGDTLVTSEIQNSSTRFADWLLTGGFGHPAVDLGTLEPTIDLDGTDSPISAYLINGQQYFFVDNLAGGSWITGRLTVGGTYTAAALGPRIIVSFGR